MDVYLNDGIRLKNEDVGLSAVHSNCPATFGRNDERIL
jgi:hypothetical protein